jgi:hypothetical protein
MVDGRTIKKRNAAISLCILLPALLIALHFHPSPLTWLLGILGGALWANWFEYAYHRWLDHTPGQFFEKKHRVHHAEPENDGHVNFGENIFWTFMVYFINGLPVVLTDFLWLRSGFSAAVLAAFVGYVLLTEEIHWRVHMGGWIPFNIGAAHHRMHHKRPLTRFNVFLPLFDWLLGTMGD